MKTLTFTHKTSGESQSIEIKPMVKHTACFEARDNGNYIEYANLQGYYRVDKHTLKITLFDGVNTRDIDYMTASIN